MYAVKEFLKASFTDKFIGFSSFCSDKREAYHLIDRMKKTRSPDTYIDLVSISFDNRGYVTEKLIETFHFLRGE